MLKFHEKWSVLRKEMYKNMKRWMVRVFLALFIPSCLVFGLYYYSLPNSREVSAEIPANYGSVFSSEHVQMDEDADNNNELSYARDPDLFEYLAPDAIELYLWDSVWVETEVTVYCGAPVEFDSYCYVLITGITNDQSVYRYVFRVSYMTDFGTYFYDSSNLQINDLTLEGTTKKSFFSNLKGEELRRVISLWIVMLVLIPGISVLVIADESGKSSLDS